MQAPQESNTTREWVVMSETGRILTVAEANSPQAAIAQALPTNSITRAEIDSMLRR